MSLAKQIEIENTRPRVICVDLPALKGEVIAEVLGQPDVAFQPIHEQAVNESLLVDEFEQPDNSDLLKKIEDLRASADRMARALNKLTRAADATVNKHAEKVQMPAAAVEASNAENTKKIDDDHKAEKTKTKENTDDMESFASVSGKSMIDTVFDFTLQVFKQPDVFVHRYSEFAKELLKIVNSKSELVPERGDRRFRDAVWQENVIYRMVLQTYLAWSNEMQELVGDLKFGSEEDTRRVQFLLNQLDAALSPSNNPLNPVAVKRAYQTGGQSVLMGLQNLMKDIKTNGGMPRQVESNACEVGKDLGISPGAVVYRNPVYEIIQYGCSDRESVHQLPILIVPPQINRFYIFDLTPKNSLVKHLIDNGLQVFIVSWRNPTQAQSHWGLETYVTELDRGVDAVRDITGSEEISLASACAGGITSMSLQSYHASIGKKAIRNHTVLVTALSAAGHPTLDLFLNKNSLKHAMERTQSKGVMEGKELAHVFAWLRPKDLVWNYWVNNNLLGKEPPTMDVLFWDNDSTRLPAALHRDFVNVLLNDRFSRSAGFEINGQQLDLSKIEGDMYFLAGDEDYLMPWKGCYNTFKLLPNARCEFVLSNSGHIQSVLRPPGIGNTHFQTNANLVDDANEWLEGSETHKGSWWEHWSEWLTQRSGELKSSPQTFGNQNFPPVCAAPGTYVYEK